MPSKKPAQGPKRLCKLCRKTITQSPDQTCWNCRYSRGRTQNTSAVSDRNHPSGSNLTEAERRWNKAFGK